MQPCVLSTRVSGSIFGMKTQVAVIRYACGHSEEHFYPLPKGTRPMSAAGILRSSEAVSTCPIAWRVCSKCVRNGGAAA